MLSGVEGPLPCDVHEVMGAGAGPGPVGIRGKPFFANVSIVASAGAGPWPLRTTVWSLRASWTIATHSLQSE
jgi:hypothetical protein